MTAYRFAVLGNPVSHSRSPAIHTAMLRLAGLEGVYEAIEADTRVLADTVTGLRAGRWHGLNVTMPLKAAAAEIADSLSPAAEKSGSVNTLLLNRAGVYGDSTDSVAFRELIGHGGFAACSSFLVLGGGGSAAAVLASLESQRTYVATRRSGQSEELTSSLGGEPIAWGAAVAGALVVNTTPIGMKGETLPEGLLEVAGGLIDLPYGATPTPAIETARGLGIHVVDGHEFLLRQAMASFAMWTGVTLEFDDVAAELRNA